MRNNIDDNISTLLASHLFVWINLPKQFNYLAAYQLVKQIYYSIFTMFLVTFVVDSQIQNHFTHHMVWIAITNSRKAK